MKYRLLPLMLALLLFLSACGSETPAATDRPWDLEVEYGDSGVTAAAWDYGWNLRTEAAVTPTQAEGGDPLGQLASIPFVNKSKTGTLKLKFAIQPKSLTVSCYTNADGYAEAVSVDPSGKDNAIPVPTEAGSYLFEVTAQWTETEEAQAWGSCTYYFRYLPEGDTGEQVGELSLYRLLKLTPDDLFGVEFFDNGQNQQKTLTTVADKTAVLEFLQQNLATDFSQIQTPTLEASYVLRLAVTDGSQLTIGYIPLEEGAGLLLSGVPYAAGTMDLQTLWDGLGAKAVSLESETPSDVLETSEDDPGAAYDDNFIYGFLRALDGTVTVDQVQWIEDEDEPNGYRIEAGETGKTYELAEDCAYWILQDHYKPFCRVEQDTLWTWAQTTGWDVVFRLYLKNGQVAAIVEQYQP